jgi:hypothetical protein
LTLRQVSWLGPTVIESDAAFSRVSAQWRTKHRFKGLTVAVTTRDSHPLPYSLAARPAAKINHEETKSAKILFCSFFFFFVSSWLIFMRRATST